MLVMDGSVVGRGCAALMIHVIYKGRALPLAWRVRQGPKGHFPEDLHIALVDLMRACLPEGTQVVFLGDGEFDGTTLQETLNEAGWFYACRTAQSTVATWEGETFRLDTLGACLKPGTLIALKEVKFTRDAYGPVMVLSCWAKGYQEPLSMVRNMDAAEEACRYDQKRFRIETFDQKRFRIETFNSPSAIVSMAQAQELYVVTPRSVAQHRVTCAWPIWVKTSEGV